MIRGVLSIAIGLFFIIGGLTGHIALRGTQSGGAMAAVGGLIAAVGVYRIVSASKG